jgi:hypothetical protein
MQYCKGHQQLYRVQCRRLHNATSLVQGTAIFSSATGNIDRLPGRPDKPREPRHATSTALSQRIRSPTTTMIQRQDDDCMAQLHGVLQLLIARICCTVSYSTWLAAPSCPSCSISGVSPRYGEHCGQPAAKCDGVANANPTLPVWLPPDCSLLPVATRPAMPPQSWSAHYGLCNGYWTVLVWFCTPHPAGSRAAGYRVHVCAPANCSHLDRRGGGQQHRNRDWKRI